MSHAILLQPIPSSKRANVGTPRMVSASVPTPDTGPVRAVTPVVLHGPLQRIGEMLHLIEHSVSTVKRVVRAGDPVYQAGQNFACLYIVNAGFFKKVYRSSEGREQVVGLHLKGDWLGLDGIATSQYGCDAVAMDTGELWALRYDDLLHASLRTPALLTALHQAMSRDLVRKQDLMLSMCTQSADTRVAGFLRYWTEALAQRGLRTDQVTLRMTRAEIGNYLGMTLESVSRALSRLARGDVIRFCEKGRRDIQIPHVEALTAFMQRGTAASTVMPLH
jgi:CRP/FNR family transcriptional regulator